MSGKKLKLKLFYFKPYSTKIKFIKLRSNEYPKLSTTNTWSNPFFPVRQSTQYTIGIFLIAPTFNSSNPLYSIKGSHIKAHYGALLLYGIYIHTYYLQFQICWSGTKRVYTLHPFEATRAPLTGVFYQIDNIFEYSFIFFYIVKKNDNLS